jgi:hypothetical protein
MTHDELLARVDEEFGIITFDENGKGLCNTLEAKGYYAIRAVVELHKPVEIDRELNYNCQECEWGYPCPTIQAIEKEL